MARPKKSEQRDTRQAILDAALDLFAERGFFGTSMREIARKVGVRESALYHHFASKDAIFEEMLKTLGPGRIGLIAGLDLDGMVKALGAKDLLKRMLDTLIAAWMAPEEQKLFRVILQEGFRLAAAEKLNPVTVIGRIRGVMVRTFTRLIELGEIRAVDPETTAIMLMGPMMLLRILHLSGTPDFEAMQREVDRLHGQLWEVLKPVKPARAGNRS